MKKCYLYKFPMETPIGNLPKSEISNYFVTNLGNMHEFHVLQDLNKSTKKLKASTHTIIF